MNKGYGQFCPVAKACEILCERWTLILARELVAGSRRFNDLRRGLPLMSPTLLSKRLKQLAEAGIVERTAGDDGGYCYQLTQAGMELRPIVELMGVWGHRWVGSQLEDADLDVGLLMWDIRRGVDASQFPNKRVAVLFEFTDAPRDMNHWWLVSESGEADLCREDPGFEVDLVIRCSVRSLTDVWMCRCSLREAEQRGEVRVMGNQKLRGKLPAWLQGSPIARLGEESLRRQPLH